MQDNFWIRLVQICARDAMNRAIVYDRTHLRAAIYVNLAQKFNYARKRNLTSSFLIFWL
jgi:hypothetical protein